jgi:pyridoxal phosphate enzyme (YggS family)
MNEIQKNVIELKNKILELESKSSRAADSVTLMAVSKTHSTQKIREVYLCGHKDFGENYLQESIQKINELKDLDITWHFIGKIQSNKSKQIAENFSWAHSIDKISTLKKINEYRKILKNNLNVCIQINVDQEATKSGICENEVEQFIKEAQKLEKINVRGLMAIPKHNDDYNIQYETFMRIKNLFDTLVNKGYKLDTLSIGMSSDFHAAIAAGSTIVRIGTSIFGERKK